MQYIARTDGGDGDAKTWSTLVEGGNELYWPPWKRNFRTAHTQS